MVYQCKDFIHSIAFLASSKMACEKQNVCCSDKIDLFPVYLVIYAWTLYLTPQKLLVLILMDHPIIIIE